ncbi:LLM class F420-dependent oxidoreductase [Aldersonia kunmingensis]|uniref:LLM class F420-dependent oxidoreductase n=1 Tax=Aldersonia kunmingensis TaxID=408066 RepID=UPI00083661BB|nr:LLM class F420-dependent oxidoreductase [Aldersonia kunmingensis]
MRVGLHALGIGTGARPDIISAVARRAEERGFATLWSGEHVVMVDDPASPYPYTEDGKIAVPAAADWLDPMITLSFAAAATSTIRLGTGVVLLPEHNPVIMAKQVASLDRLSGGRLTFGVGIGWSREEFDALGIPFERRAARTVRYLDAMRTLWRADGGPASYESEFVGFDRIRVNPSPSQDPLPIVFGGNSDQALKRVAELGDGWYGFNLDGIAAVDERMRRLGQACTVAGRGIDELQVAVALREPNVDDLPSLAALGVTELVIVDSPPASVSEVSPWVDQLADTWIP